MGFKANFCCFCCCGMKPKKLTRSVAILFIVVNAILAIMIGANMGRYKGAALISPIISLLMYAGTIVFSIVVLIMIGKGNWGLVKCYGIFEVILNS